MGNEYNGSLTREQFLFYEIRITAQMMVEGLSKDEIVQRIIAENLFQFPTERMIASIAGTCLKRLKALGSEALIEHLASDPVKIGKQINLYAMMKQNRLVWDFMTTVIGEKYRTQAFEFSKKDVNVFFLQLQEQNDKVAAWSENTISRIKQILVRILVECDYLDSNGAPELNSVSICPELEEALRAKGDFAALPAFNCFL